MENEITTNTEYQSKMTSKRTLKDFFNRRRDHSEEIAREGGQESFQGEFGSMDSFMQVCTRHSYTSQFISMHLNGEDG